MSEVCACGHDADDHYTGCYNLCENCSEYPPQPAPDTRLREAAQAVVDFDWAMWERGGVGTVVMRRSDVALMFALLAALRAALEGRTA